MGIEFLKIIWMIKTEIMKTKSVNLGLKNGILAFHREIGMILL